jgi:hypothetical protein
MAEDLAIDIGIPRDSEEFDSFVGCIENLLEYGCGYGDDWTEDILEKCRKSKLDIAKKVIEELEKPRSRYRQRNMKWWQRWQPKTSARRQNASQANHSKRRAPQTKRYKKPMSPMFERRGSKRPMSPMFDQRSRGKGRHSPDEIQYERRGSKRPMSPMFDQRSDYNHGHPEDHHQRYASRYNSPPARYSEVPEWPGRSPDRRRYTPVDDRRQRLSMNNRNKRRRYRR